MKRLAAAILMIATLGTTGLAQTNVLRWGGDSEGGAPNVFQDPKDPRRLIGF
jgi:polar amino acid transport system substrate-binding protein